MESSNDKYSSLKKTEIDFNTKFYIDDKKSEFMIYDNQESDIDQNIKEVINEEIDELESSSIQQNALLLLVEESNKDISNRIKTYKSTPNKYAIIQIDLNLLYMF